LRHTTQSCGFEALLTKKTSLLKGMNSKSGKKFDAFIAMMKEERPLLYFPKEEKEINS
jgi:DNA topoisomerase-3